jgi:hypothetical protein
MVVGADAVIAGPDAAPNWEYLVTFDGGWRFVDFDAFKLEMRPLFPWRAGPENDLCRSAIRRREHHFAADFGYRGIPTQVVGRSL